jgi:uncharacterized damage-inducible protein DinB
MSAATSTTNPLIDAWRQQAGATTYVLGVNTAGLSHEESLMAPSPAGNCLNWVLGHLIWVYDGVLPVLGKAPVMPQGALDQYARGGPPLDPAGALRLEQLREAWDTAAARVDEGLAELAPGATERLAPFSPRNDPGETVGSLLSTIMFHQAYHAGQLGLLRRLIGREGAIK